MKMFTIHFNCGDELSIEMSEDAHNMRLIRKPAVISFHNPEELKELLIALPRVIQRWEKLQA